jgi:replicative DNA helicase
MRRLNAEQLLISRILVDADLITPNDANLHARFFGSPGAADAWIWINQYRTEYGQVPTAEAFLRKHSGYQLDLSPDEPMGALIDEVFAGYKRRLVSEGLQAAVQGFSDTSDADAAMAVMQGVMSTVATDLSRSEIQVSTDIIGKLVVKYVNAEENHMPGIPTGFSMIDEALGGLQDEQLVTIVGLPKRMKSSYLLAMAMSAERNGYRAGVVSFEMSNTEQQARYLSLGAGVSLTRMQRGELTEAEIARLHEFEAMVTETDGWGSLVFIHDVGGADTVEGLVAKQEQHGFDVLFVDGLYLMTDSLGEPKGSSQALTNITRGVKRFAQVAKIPIVCTTQALHSRTTKARGVEMESIGYTSSFAQDSDVLIGIDRPDMQLPVAKLKVIAARNAMGMECEVSIDYTKGVISDHGPVSPELTAALRYGGDDDD